MENLKIEAGVKTPHVFFDAENGVLEISGKSIPENSVEFFRPLYEWLDRYIAMPAKRTEVKIKLEYFNTSSSKCILDIFRKLEQVKDGNVQVNWFYEEDDEDMQEAGEDYQAIVKLPFTISKA